MKNILILIFVCSLTSAYAQNMILPLWPDGVPNRRDSGEKELSDTTNAVRVSLVQDPTIAVYLPAQKNASGEAVVICPGGGYVRLAYDYEGLDIAKFLNGKGIAGIVLKYRLPNSKSNIVPYKSPLMDAQQAMKMVREHAKEWNINPEKVGIMGFSAGGHLASTLGTHFDEASRPNFMALIYPVITMDTAYTHAGSRKNLLGDDAQNEELVKNFSNELQIKDNTPPTFMVHALDDRAVPVENSFKFAEALKAKGIPAELHIYPHGGHGFSLATGDAHLSTWTDRFIDWLRSLE